MFAAISRDFRHSKCLTPAPRIGREDQSVYSEIHHFAEESRFLATFSWLG
jgi:hypothetical protein